jgi:hypothetical protein
MLGIVGFLIQREQIAGDDANTPTTVIPAKAGIQVVTRAEGAYELLRMGKRTGFQLALE